MGGNLSGKRGTEDLDFFIGDEALAAAGGPGRLLGVVAGLRKLNCVQDTEYITLCGTDKSRTGYATDYIL